MAIKMENWTDSPTQVDGIVQARRSVETGEVLVIIQSGGVNGEKTAMVETEGWK